MSKNRGFFFRKSASGQTVPTWGTKLLIWIMPVLFLGAGMGWLASSHSWVANARAAEAVVTAVATMDTAGNDPVYYIPEFEFALEDGSKATAKLGLASPDFNFEIGSKHEILYDPVAGGPVRFPGFAFNYFGATLVLAMSAMFALVSLVLWLWVKAIAQKLDQEKKGGS